MDLRILQVSTHDVVGGAARSAYRLHRGLIRRGHDCRMLVLRQETDDPTVSAFRPPQRLVGKIRRRARRLKLRREHAPYRKPGWVEAFSDDRSVHAWHGAPPLKGCDVVNLHWVARFVDYRGFFEAVPLSIPVVWTLRDMNIFTGGCHYDDGCGRYRERCGACPQLGSDDEDDLSRDIWRRKREVFARLDPSWLRIVTPSRWMAEEVRRSSLLGARFEVTVIPNGVDTDEFAPRDREAARATLGIPQGARVVLFVAYSVGHRRKGFATLGDALRELSATSNLFSLSVGGGRPPLEIPVPQLHMGKVTQNRLLSLIYSAADVYVIPSLQDNLPSTVLEAMACGTPVVGSDVGGIPEMVRPGVTGVLATPGDVSALATAIESVLHDTEVRRKMGEQCRRLALEEYGMKPYVGRYEELYRSLVEGAASRTPRVFRRGAEVGV